MDFLLQENGDLLLLEEGTGALLLEAAPPTPPPSYATWKAGIITVPGSTGVVSVTGLGGTPAAVVFFGTNWTTEDSPVTTAHTGLFRGMAAPKWDDPGTIEQNAVSVVPSGDAYHESNGHCMNMLDLSGGLAFAYTAIFDSFDADGFSVDFDGVAVPGHKVVWVALMDVAEIGALIGGQDTVALGWKVGAALLHGSWGGPDNGLADQSRVWMGGGAYPGSAGGSTWYGAGLSALTYPTSAFSQYLIGIYNQPPGTQIANDNTFIGPFLEPQNVTAVPTGGSLTDFTVNTNLADNAGMFVMWDDEDSQTGRVDPTPDNDTDTVTVTGLPFEPGLVIGYSVSDEPSGQGTGGRGAIGLSVALSNGFQWCAVADGHSSQGAYQSYSRGFADVANGATAHAGTCTLTEDGFVLETTEDSADPAPDGWVWHAFGHPDRIVKWIPHIYRRILG